MTKDEITAWALANGWQMIDGAPSLTKPNAPHPAIVRLVLGRPRSPVWRSRKPAGKWEKVASQSYSKIQADLETEKCRMAWDSASFPGFTLLMRDNKDRQVFSGLKPR